MIILTFFKQKRMNLSQKPQFHLKSNNLIVSHSEDHKKAKHPCNTHRQKIQMTNDNKTQKIEILLENFDL